MAPTTAWKPVAVTAAGAFVAFAATIRGAASSVSANG